MRKLEFGQAISVVANLGVIAGLVFVGIQLRQDRQLAAIAGMEESANAMRYWAELIANNSELWVKGRNGKPLSEVEQAEFEALAGAWQFQDYVRWYRASELPQSRAADTFISETAETLYRYPGLRAFWQQQRAQADYRDKLFEEELGSTWSDRVDDRIRRLEEANVR